MVLGRVLKADLHLLSSVEAEIKAAEEALAELLPLTPAGILTTLPGVGVVRASNYGAGIGDPHRFPNAGAGYRAAGLVPTMYESAGRKRPGQHISREGSVNLRRAIVEMGRGLSQHDPDFRQRRLLDDHKPPAIAAVAVGRRAHRLAFAMMRDGQPYDPQMWTDSVTAGKAVMAKTVKAQQNDAPCPPPVSSLNERRAVNNRNQ